MSESGEGHEVVVYEVLFGDVMVVGGGGFEPHREEEAVATGSGGRPTAAGDRVLEAKGVRRNRYVRVRKVLNSLMYNLIRNI